MAVPQDLARIAFLANKAIIITRAAVVGTAILDPGDLDGETLLTITPAQQATIFQRRAAVLAELKTLAAGLPSA